MINSLPIKQFFLVLLTYLSCTAQTQKADILLIQLNKNWQFRQADSAEWLPATVPGTVHTDLYSNRKIGDPFYRTNERDQQWIDKVDWEYKTTFTADADLLSKDHVRLVFKGLDTYADVSMNGKNLFSATNMFREWRADCKSLLKDGNNELRIYFHSPVKIDLPKLEAMGYQLPAVNDQSENGGLGDKKISVFARKAGYHYGWDWGPRFVISGIWRLVYVEAWNQARIENIQYVQNNLTTENADLTAVFEIESDNELAASLSISYQGKILIEKRVDLKQGLHQYPINFQISNPQLWWTNGLGEAFLYELSSKLKTGTKLLADDIQKIGLRTIRVVQEKNDTGKSFYFELNGVPVFAKGANYIPNDNFIPRVTSEKYEHIIKSAADANMNMLRVWGGGIYENDIFYDLCDRYGILIWHDFMFACSMYPGDEEFIDNVKKEAIQNVKRLRNHPCIALWCGNNEIDVAWSHDTAGGWRWKEQYDEKTRARIWHDYEKIFHELLPGVVKTYDPKTFYWPSSPLADFGERASYSNASGDMHYWGVWHGKEPFENFKRVIPRFMSEYGFQSFPEFKTIKTYTIPEDWDIDSEVMSAHQRSGIGNRRIKSYMDLYYREPHDFQSLLYVGQVLQAEGIKMAIEAHRREKPYCMGSLYWQLNDCWPVASWSGADYYGRWKALHYFAKKAFNQILVSPTVDSNELKVFIVSDALDPLTAELKLEIMDFPGNLLWQKQIPVVIKANSSDFYFKDDVKKMIENFETNKILLRATVLQSERILSQNTLYFTLIKDLELAEPHIEQTITKTDSGYRILLSTDRLAKNVYLSIDDADGFFTDNYFDLVPGDTVEVDFLCKDISRSFEDSLKIMSLRDTY